MTDGQPEDQPGGGESTRDAALVEKCMDVVSAFRTGSTGKHAATVQLYEILHQTDGDRAAFVQTIGSYIAMLDSYERFRDSAAGGGRTGAQPGDAGGPGPGAGADGRDGSIEQATPPRPDKRQRSPDAEHDVDDSPSKRRINTKLFPWAARDAIDPPVLEPDLEATRAAIENYSCDIKLAKASLRNNARCPQFPDSEWTNLLTGNAIDLDRVLSNINSSTRDERRTESVGHLEIVTGSQKPAKKVDSHGNWVLAWAEAVKAILFVFPHRQDELERYTAHIHQLFSALLPHLHQRVFQYDLAVRIRTASRRDLRLCNTAAFTDLHVVWIQSPASPTYSPTSAGGTGGASGRRGDPCKRWNSGKCPNSATNCRYSHVCAKCHHGSHVSSKCTTNPKLQ